MNVNLRTSSQGLACIAFYEGNRLDPYICPSKKLTILIGHCITHAELIAGKFTTRPLTEAEANVVLGERNSDHDRLKILTPIMKPLTKEDGYKVLGYDMARFESYIRQAVKVPLLQREFDGTASMIMNTGPAPLYGTFGKLLNAGEKHKAFDAMLAWNKGGQPLRVLPGLAKRREDERAICLGLPYELK